MVEFLANLLFKLAQVVLTLRKLAHKTDEMIQVTLTRKRLPFL